MRGTTEISKNNCDLIDNLITPVYYPPNVLIVDVQALITTIIIVIIIIIFINITIIIIIIIIVIVIVVIIIIIINLLKLTKPHLEYVNLE